MDYTGCLAAQMLISENIMDVDGSVHTYISLL